MSTSAEKIATAFAGTLLAACVHLTLAAPTSQPTTVRAAAPIPATPAEITTLIEAAKTRLAATPPQDLDIPADIAQALRFLEPGNKDDALLLSRTREFVDGKILIIQFEKFLEADGLYVPTRLERQFKAGDTHAAAMLACCYSQKKQYDLAVTWAKRAHEMGDISGTFWLGNFYLKGWGVPKDNAMGLQFLNKCVEHGDLDALVYLAVMYQTGDGVPQNLPESRRLLQIGVDLHHARATNYFGLQYFDRPDIPPNHAEARKLFVKAAELGSVDALRNLGELCGAEKDDAQAMDWFRRAADLGDDNAMVIVGRMYDDGAGVEKSPAEARKSYDRAVQLTNNADALWCIAWQYRKGLGVKQDMKQAIAWFKKAADAGSVSAMGELGWFYSHSKAVGIDYGESLKWYEKAAENGDTKIMCILGNIYYNGEGRPQDLEKAFQWYQKSAEAGNVEAMVDIAYLYKRGDGTTMDTNLAAKWFRKAAQLGNDRARQWLKEHPEEMQPAE